MENIFDTIKADDKRQQDSLVKRRDLIEELKRENTPYRKRMAELKSKAKKAQKFLKDPNYLNFEEYINDLRIEFNIKNKNVGLTGKSAEEIGIEAVKVSTAITVLERIVSEPKRLLKLL